MVYTSGDLMKDAIGGAAHVAEGAKHLGANLGTGAKSLLGRAWNPEDLPDATPLQNKVHKSGSKILAGATVFIGTTALLDMGMRAAKRAEAEREKKRQIKSRMEQEEAKRQKAREYREGASVIHGTDLGKVVFDMFEQRTGHHRMGNSHFYK